MKITGVIFYKDTTFKSLALCSVILEDAIRINNIRLFKNDKGYYLVMPSKQDIYQDIERENPDTNLILPENKTNSKWEEFFYPINKDLYKDMLVFIKTGYKVFKKEGICSIRF